MITASEARKIKKPALLERYHLNYHIKKAASEGRRSYTMWFSKTPKLRYPKLVKKKAEELGYSVDISTASSSVRLTISW